MAAGAVAAYRPLAFTAERTRSPQLRPWYRVELFFAGAVELAACNTLGKPRQSRTSPAHSNRSSGPKDECEDVSGGLIGEDIRQAENQQREIKKQALPSLPKLYARLGDCAEVRTFPLRQNEDARVSRQSQLRTHKQRGVRAEAKRAPRPLAPAERRVIDGAARAQRLQDAGGAARDPILGRPTTDDHYPLSNHSQL